MAFHRHRRFDLPPFILFEELLTAVNADKGIFKPVGDNIYQTQSFDVLGLETLWEIVLAAKSEEVADRAARLLNETCLFHNMVPEMEDSAGEHRANHVRFCMDQLARSAERLAELSGSSSEAYTACKKRVLRSLAVLHGFLSMAESRLFAVKTAIKTHHRSRRGHQLVVTVVSLCSQQQQRRFELCAHSNNIVAQLRSQVAVKLREDDPQLSQLKSSQLTSLRCP